MLHVGAIFLFLRKSLFLCKISSSTFSKAYLFCIISLFLFPVDPALCKHVSFSSCECELPDILESLKFLGGILFNFWDWHSLVLMVSDFILRSFWVTSVPNFHLSYLINYLHLCIFFWIPHAVDYDSSYHLVVYFFVFSFIFCFDFLDLNLPLHRH